MTTKYCALCLLLWGDQRPDLLPDSSVEITVINGQSSCARHFLYLRLNPLEEAAEKAIERGILPNWAVSP